MILSLLEHSQGSLGRAALSVIRASLEMKAEQGYSKVVGLLLGSENLEQVAEQASKFGLDEICYAKAEFLYPYTALNYAAVCKQIFQEKELRAVVLSATSQGKDLAPRLAHLLDAPQVSDITQVLAGHVFSRPMYAGNIIAEVEVLSERKVVTARMTAFDAATPVSTASPINEIKLNVSADDRQKFISFDTVKSERPELTDAHVIVSGGRALKSAENFEKYLFPLAEALNAAVGASRAAVDSGYAPNDWQVGQTGKVVAPSLYIAVGISGAIQHLAGMKDSKVIVAINKDPEAPIFEVADYGLVADLFEALPALTELLRK